MQNRIQICTDTISNMFCVQNKNLKVDFKQDSFSGLIFKLRYQALESQRTYTGPPNTFFCFLENGLKKATEYFLKFLFLFESTILPVNNCK